MARAFFLQNMPCSTLAIRLGDLLAQLSAHPSSQSWRDVELTAQDLANRLRVKDAGQSQSLLGRRS
jgi:hypothetical protein